MRRHLRRPTALAGILSLFILVTAAAQTPKFPGGVFRTSDGTNAIAIDFDSTGVLNVYVNNESFSNGTWRANGDTLTFGKIQGPEGYNCVSEARYRWSLTENRITFATIDPDDCQSRRDSLLGLAWTKG